MMLRVCNLGGREMLSCMREGISVCVVVVLVVTVGVVCLGAVEVDSSGVVDNFVLGGVLVVVVVVEVDLVVGCVVS